MKKVIMALAALAIAVALAAAPADAGSRKKHKRYAKSNYERSTARAQSDRGSRSFDQDRYFERDSNRLPFGTAIWWEQMEREGRLGSHD